MADETNNKNSAENPVEVSLKTPSDFYSPSNLHQPQESCQDHSMQEIDGNLRAFSTFLRNLLQNRQTLWVILQRFWQKTNQKR